MLHRACLLLYSCTCRFAQCIPLPPHPPEMPAEPPCPPSAPSCTSPLITFSSPSLLPPSPLWHYDKSFLGKGMTTLAPLVLHYDSQQQHLAGHIYVSSCLVKLQSNKVFPTTFTHTAALHSGHLHLRAVLRGGLLPLQPGGPLHSPHCAVCAHSQHQRLHGGLILHSDGGHRVGQEHPAHLRHLLRTPLPHVLLQQHCSHCIQGKPGCVMLVLAKSAVAIHKPLMPWCSHGDHGIVC